MGSDLADAAHVSTQLWRKCEGDLPGRTRDHCEPPQVNMTACRESGAFHCESVARKHGCHRSMGRFTMIAVIVVLQRALGLAARGESLAAFDGRCIPGGRVAPRSHTPGILGRRALPAGRLARLGATPDFHHGLLGH